MVFKLIDGGMGTNLRKLEWNDIPVKAPFKIENKVHDLFASCDIITTNTFAIDAGYHVSEWRDVIHKSIENAKQIANNKLILLSISELSDREQIKVLVNALTSEIKASGLSSDQIMILFETFTSIDTVHKMMSELDNLDIEERYKHCIMSCTYNARSLSDGTTPREVAAYCNRYDFIKYVGQNCCDITTDIDFVLSEYTKVTNKYLFCKPNTDAINVDTLLKYIDKYNLAIAGFCCGSSKELIEEVKELLPTNKEIIKNNIVESTYIRELLPSGSIVGDRINTTKNKKLIGWLENRNFDEIARLAQIQKINGAKVIDLNISFPNEEEIIAELIVYLQDNTDCKFFIDSSNPNVIKKALKVYKGVPLINSINYETDINLFNEYEMYSPAYIFMEIKEGIINEICRNPLPVKLNKHNILVDCCVEPLDINPNAFNELSDRIKNVPEEYQIILGISNLSHHFLDRKGIDTNAYALLKNRCIFIANTQNVLYNDSMINILYNTPTDKKLMDVKDYIVNGVIPNDETIKSFLDKDSIEVIEKKILDALNFIGEQFEARKITTYELQAAAKVTKILLNKYFPTDLNNSKPEIIIATVKGDFHDIGKTIVCSLMSAHKISFIDLGVNVSIDSISQTLIKYPSIKIVALSGLIYPSVDEAKNDIEYIHKNFESVEVYVGGAVFNNAIAKDINADGYFSTALESVNYFAKLLNK